MRREADRGKIRPSRGRRVRYFGGLGSGVSYGVHDNNLINLRRGIVERVLYVRRGEGLSKPPQPLNDVFARLASVRARLVASTPPTPRVALEKYPALYTGRKRRIYQSAVDSLKTRGLTVRDSWVDTFLKAEKINFFQKWDPAPRVIQPRSPRYTAALGCFLKKLEPVLLHAGFKKAFGHDVVMKGLNAQQVGAALAGHWGAFRNPVAIGLDASRFDQHVSRAALEWEHSVYNSIMREPELRRLLSWQLKNRGIARVDGWRLDYTTDGCRMSGDINTSLGNCIIMSCIVIAYCEWRGIDYRLANNGDDCVLFVDRSQLNKTNGLDRWFLDFGFTLTREEPVYVLEAVEFCQAHPVRCANGWRMVRNPHTAMSKDCVSLVGWESEREILDWGRAIGTCGLSLTSGVPVWEAWYRQFYSMAGATPDGVQSRVDDCGMGYMARGVNACEIDEEARFSFWRAFGISPDEQLALEAEYAEPFVITAMDPKVYYPPCTIDHNPIAKWPTRTAP